MPTRSLFCAALATVALGAASAQAADQQPPADTDLEEESVAAPAAAAQDGSTGKALQERIRAVSRRVFLKRQRFEVEPLFGFTANDALNRFWSFGARGAWHFNEELAIDFGGGGGFNQPLQDIRIVDGSELDLKLAEQVAYADVGVTFSPFYGKFALMAEQVIHFDGFISGGLGAIVDNTAEVVHPALELGVGTRVFLTRWLTLRADLRNYAYPLTVNDELTFPSALILTFGLGFHVPFDFDYSSETIGAKG
jgi:outer membrane beta-barrel protein